MVQPVPLQVGFSVEEAVYFSSSYQIYEHKKDNNYKQIQRLNGEWLNLI